MTKAELIKALQNLKVQTGSLTCLGCGYEYGCNTRGCAIIKAAVEEPSSSPISIGDAVYHVVCDNSWRVVEEKVTEIGVNGFFVPFEKGGTEPSDYITYSNIGNEWFLSKEEAEQMAKTRKAEKMCCNCAYWDDIPFDGGCTCKQSKYYSEYPNETDSCSCFKECEYIGNSNISITCDADI